MAHEATEKEKSSSSEKKGSLHGTNKSYFY